MKRASMKKLQQRMWGAVLVLLALSACRGEAEFLSDASQTNESENPSSCVLVTDDFR